MKITLCLCFIKFVHPPFCAHAFYFQRIIVESLGFTVVV